jgi:hypothetical protein
MRVLIEHYKKNNQDTLYYNGKPVVQITEAKLPLRFGYGSFNEPRKLLDYNIDIEDIIKITEGELNLSDN